MRLKPVITFLGPVQWTGKWIAGIPAHFLFLQSNGTTLKLEYNARSTAADARADLLATPLTYPVNSMRLLQAIQAALHASLKPAQDPDHVEDAASRLEMS